MKSFFLPILLSLGVLFLQPCCTKSPSTRPDPSNLKWQYQTVFYEIFVRSFYDTNGDGIGDIRGIIEKLDYLNDGDPETDTDLGITGIWLMPVFKSPSYHGYDTTDYFELNPDYGTLNDLEELLKKAKERGLRLILDLVLNHASNQHPYFEDAQENPASPYRDYFIWRTEDPGWTQPWGTQPVWHQGNGDYYYGVFTETMPDWNFRNQAVVSAFQDIALYWLDKGIDGFRVDAARYIVEDAAGNLSDLPETHAFFKEYATYLKRLFPDLLLVAEAWADLDTVATYYGNNGDEFDLAFDFDLSTALINSIRNQDPAALKAQLQKLNEKIPALHFEAPFLTNHDMVRVSSQLSKDMEKLKLAAGILLTLPGTPFIYYGEEIGLTNGLGYGGDENKRTPMQWNALPNWGFTSLNPWYPCNLDGESINVEAQQKDPNSLLSLYQRLIRIRQEYSALCCGEMEIVTVLDSDSTILSLLRTRENERVLTLYNFSENPQDATLDFNGSSLKPGDYEVFEIWNLTNPENITTQNHAEYQVRAIPAHSVVLLGFEAD